MNQDLPFPIQLEIRSEKHLAFLLHSSIKEITKYTSQKEKYIRPLKIITKKNDTSKTRIVIDTISRYKQILRNLNKFFQLKASLPSGVLGGVVGKSIDEMAIVHCGQEAVLTIDLKDFFPTIKAGKVFNFFIKAGCTSNIAALLTDLVTHEQALPQGFPTSPMLANLILFELDKEHLNICHKNSIKRTRWIDDIVFSGRSQSLKKSRYPLCKAVEWHGFVLNDDKTKICYRKNDPIAVGLELSGSVPRIPQVVVDKIINLLNECKSYGFQIVQSKYEVNRLGKPKNLKASLAGKIKRLEKYGHSAADEMWEIFNSIDWKGKA